ncbi:AAA family ATPase [Nonomuraea fuscirosea]|uniref:caspase, EACC1-associated type n=1 Tax=Nonomuraea fuscirosea TaxID=1291556 RepID=UPI00349A44F9
MTILQGDGVRAVLIGVGAFPDGSLLPGVPKARDAAMAFGECLVEVAGLAREHLFVIPDTNNPGEVVETISALSRQADSLLLVYYAGHGLLDENSDLHLATGNTRSYNPRFADSLPYEQVRRAVRDGAWGGGRATIIILDCCYAGTAAPQFTSAAQGGFAQSTVTGAYVLLSSAGHEQSWCLDDAPYPTFSQVLMEILTAGVPGHGPWLDLDVVYEELDRRLRRLGAPQPRRHVQDKTNKLILAPNLAYGPTKPTYPEPREQPDLPPGVSPYKNLDPYGIDDHDLFYGRKAAVKKLLGILARRARDGHLQLVAGPSGVGKSSLLQAGVLYAIGRGELGIPGSARWPRVVLTLDADPLEALARWISQWSQRPSDADPALMRERLRAAPATFADLLAEHPPVFEGEDSCRVVLVIDQFEKALSGQVDEVDLRAFFLALRAAAAPREGKGPIALVVAAIRSDFLGAYQEYGERDIATDERLYLLDPMSHDELIEVIEEPAQRSGMTLENGLVDQLLHDVDVHTMVGPSPVRARSVLPHLSSALQATWENREIGRAIAKDGTVYTWPVMTLPGYRASGGVPGALSQLAETAYHLLQEPEREAAPRVFVALVRSVRMGDAVVQTGRSLSRTDLAELAPPDRVAKIVEVFLEKRLLTVDDDDVAFAHEAVIPSWPRLRGWIAQDRVWLELQRDIEEEAAKWSAATKSAKPVSTAEEGAKPTSADREFLLGNARLDRVDEVIRESGRTPADLTPLSRDFLTASRSARARRTRIRQGLTAMLVTLTLLSLGFGIAARVNAVQAQAARADAQSRAAASEAIGQRSVDPAVSAQLAVAAYRIAPTVQARGALLSTASLPMVTRATDHVGLTHGSFAMALARDRRTVASAGADGFISLWDVSAPQRPKRLSSFQAADGHPVFAIDFDRTGDVLALGAYDGRIDLWDVSKRAAPKLLAHVAPPKGGQIFSLAFSPDGRMLVTGGAADASVHFWNVRAPRKPTPARAAALAVSAPIAKLAFSPDGRTLAVAGINRPDIRLIDLTPGTAPMSVRVLAGHEGAVEALAFSPDGRTLASGAKDNTVRLWNVADPARAKQKGLPLTGHANAIYALGFSPDGTELASGGNDNTVRIWRIGTPTEIVTLSHPGPVQAAIFLSSGELATSGNDGLLRLWHLPGRMLLGPSGQIGSAVFSPSGDTLAEGESDGRLWLWNVADPAHPVPYGPPMLTVKAGERSGINRMMFSPDGRLLAVPCNNGEIQLWNVADPHHPVLAGPPLTGHKLDVDAVAFLGGGRVLASASNDTTVRLWDIANPRSPHPIGGPLTQGNGAVFDVAASPDGHTLAAAGGGSVIEVWDIREPTHPVPIRNPLRGHTGPVLGLAFDQTGKILASAGVDGVVRFWSMSDPANPVMKATQLRNAGGAITKVAFGPAPDHLLAIANADGSVWLWAPDGAGYQLHAQLVGHNQSAFFAAFSPDGRTLATSSTHPIAFLWTTSPDDMIGRICGTVGAPLRPEELELLLPDDPDQRICY